MPDEAHEPTEAWLRARVADWQRTARVPSLVIGWSRDSSSAGVVCSAGDVPGIAADVQYRVGSITKTFTAALVMRLRDHGSLDIDEPLESYLPELPAGNVRVRDVLAHISGLRENPDGSWWELGFARSADELFAGGDWPMMAMGASDRVHHYSNLGYALAGWLLERMTGQAWDRLLSESLLRPLGLNRTGLTPSEPYATGYLVHPWHGTATAVPLSGTGGMAPAGQLWSSVHDLLRWGRCLLGENEEVLSLASAQEMRRPVVMADEQWREGQGTGLQLWRDEQAIYAGHGGSVPGFCAAMLTHHPSGNVVAVCANGPRSAHSNPTLSVGFEVLRKALAEWSPGSSPSKPNRTPPRDVVDLTGSWWTLTSEHEVTWDDQAAALVMTPVDDRTQVSRFTCESTDTWHGFAGPAMGESLEIERDADRRPIALSQSGVTFKRYPYLCEV